MFCLSIRFKLPVINLAVPKTKGKSHFRFSWDQGHRYISSINNCECSVSFTIESSRNVIAILPLVVIASSLLCIANFKLAS